MDAQSTEVSKGLNSPELRRNTAIPFVDDFIELDHVNTGEPIRPKREKKEIHATDLGEVRSSPDNDTIVVNTPEGTLYITLEPDSTRSSKFNSPVTQSTDLSSPSTSKAAGANESMAMIEREREEEQRWTNLRRNSISMPTLQNLESEVLRQQYLQSSEDQIPEHHQSSASGFSDGDTHPDLHETLSDDDRTKAPLRSPRRKRRVRSEFSMDEDDYSPNNSVVSVNSLASLLREKIQNIPQKIRKKPTDYKLRAFVGLMFLSVAFFVGFAYVLYHQQASAHALFDALQFNEPRRMLKVFNADDVEILRAHLAVNLQPTIKAYPCLPEHRREGSQCLEWLQAARLYLACLPHDPGLDNTTCYSVHWQSLRHDVHPTDCFDYVETKAHWYGGVQAANLTWPLEAGSIPFTPFITGDVNNGQFGNILTRYFINSKGAAVIVDDATPLHVSVNKGNNQICIKAQYDNFAYANKLTEFPEMRYNICTSRDMQSLHSSIHSHQRAPLWDGLKPADMQTLDALISEPVWRIAPRFKHELQTETISNYTEDVINLGFFKQGHVLINEYWQNEIGDLTLDPTRFENLSMVIDKLHRRGFKIVFTIQPFISTESKNFAECVQKRLLISERDSDRRIPALTRYKSVASAGVLDITNNRTVSWLLEKLRAVTDEYHIDSFFLDLGTAYDMPKYYRTEVPLTNPDEYKTIFTKMFAESLSVVGVSAGARLPRPPTFVALAPRRAAWAALRAELPAALAAGVGGYPFVMPGAVGGDASWPPGERFLPADGSLAPDAAADAPDVELYCRWLQLATFLPVISFSHLPTRYGDERVLEMAKNLTILRQKVVRPALLSGLRAALERGLAAARPLWAVGGDGGVADEFIVGDDLLVAPVLEPGKTSRDVYLPGGLWQDGIDGSLRKGNRWLHEYRVPPHRVAYFTRRPDDLRF